MMLTRPCCSFFASADLDPLILCHSASLYLLKHILSTSLDLATLLVTHPFHTHDPFLWVLFGSVLSASGQFALADEALSEALTKDERCSAGWAALTANHLRRVQREHHVLNRASQGRAAGPKDSEFDEARAAFQHVLHSPAPCQDPRLLVELARLWLRHGFHRETEQCYTRALMVHDDDAIRTKLHWLRHAQERGAEPEREANAAIKVQSAMRGAIARKQAKRKKMQQHLGTNGKIDEEKDSTPQEQL